MTTKVCTNCLGEPQPLANFQKGKGKDGLRTWCKRCVAEYDAAYYKTHPRTKDQLRRGSVATRRARRAAVAALKAGRKCARCPENHPACLDFHHLDPRTKSFPISNYITRGYTKEALQREVEKCELLCANCHRKEHYRGEVSE